MRSWNCTNAPAGKAVRGSSCLSMAMLCSLALAFPAKADDAIDNLSVRRSSRSGMTTFVTANDGGPASITKTNTQSLTKPADPLKNVGKLFGVTDAQRQLMQAGSRTDSLGHQHTAYLQVHNGVPVFSGELKVHQDAAGRFVAMNGRFYPIAANLSTMPRLGAEAAGIVAQAMVGSGDVAGFATKLVIVDPGWYGDPAIGPHLAYYVVVTVPSGGIEEAFFIDASNGDVLDRWSIVCQALDRAIYDAAGSTTLPGTLSRSESDPPVADSNVNAIYDYAGDTYDYFFNAFGRDGFDDLGGTFIGSANADTVTTFNCPNASWSFLLHRMTFCTDTTSDDVVAHEITHGVTQFTANLIYQNQSGQLNESFSDVFGELVDLFNSDSAFAGSTGTTPWTPHGSGAGSDALNNLRGAGCSLPESGFPDGYRWLMGEDAIAFRSGLGTIRDMWNPAACFADSDRANSPFQTCDLLDNGGVHSGSGVVNHAFAILCDGKTFNGQTVSGIGPIKAGAVWYRALSTYLTVGSDFEDAYAAFLQAAADLEGTFPNDPRTGTPSAGMFTAADTAEVDKALLAVEMNTPGACGESVAVLNSVAPSQCADRLLIFQDDFEGGINGWTVSNSAPPTAYDWVQTTGLPLGRTGAAWFCADPNIGDCSGVNEAGLHSLFSPVVMLPAGLDTITLSFAHFVETEPRFDGGNVLLSVNAGPWQPLTPFAYRYNAYNTSLFTNVEQGNTSPLAGQVTFSGVGGQWGTSLIDLGAFAMSGDTIQIRFDFGKDDCFGFTGWFIDDLEIYGCNSSGDCNDNGVPDELDVAGGPAADLLWKQEPNVSSGNLSDADPHPALGVNKLAEDFTLLRDRTIHAFKIWGGYTGDTPVATDLFTVIIHEDDGGLPGVEIASEVDVASTRTATGREFLGVGEYEYTLTLATPFNLPTGSYFVEIFNDTTGDSTTFIWERALFGWILGAANFGQGCDPWCFQPLPNFAIEMYGGLVGRMPADLNADEAVDVGDVGPFVEVLLDGTPEPDIFCAADINQDSTVNGNDIAGFVDCVLGAGCP